MPLGGYRDTSTLAVSLFHSITRHKSTFVYLLTRGTEFMFERQNINVDLRLMTMRRRRWRRRCTMKISNEMIRREVVPLSARRRWKLGPSRSPASLNN